MKDFLDNKKFWKNVKPLFSDKITNGQKITLVKGDEIISNDNQVAETFNVFFKDAVNSLDIPTSTDILNPININSNMDPIDCIIEQYSSHPSVLKINEKDLFKYCYNFCDNYNNISNYFIYRWYKNKKI